MVVDHDDVEPEVGLLAECRGYGVGYAPAAVAHGNYHRGFGVERLGIEVFGHVQLRQPRPDGLEVGRAGGLHFLLDVGVAGVHVVELLLAREPCVGVGLGVEAFGQMHDGVPTRHAQAQVVEGGEAVVGVHGGHGLGKGLGGVGHQRSEVEIVAQAARLIVDDGMRLDAAAAHHPAVGIDHAGAGLHQHGRHPLQSLVGEAERLMAGADAHHVAAGGVDGAETTGGREPGQGVAGSSSDVLSRLRQEKNVHC